MADTIDIARLRALVAGAAKPPYFMKAADQWTSADGRHVQFGRYDISTGSHDVEAENYYRVASVSNINNSPVNLANALLFNEAPTAILSLCDEVDRLRQSLTAAKVVIEGQDRRALAAARKVAPLVAAAADVDGERAANAILTAENDRLRSELEAVKADAGRIDWLEKWHSLRAGEPGYGDTGIDLITRSDDGFLVDADAGGGLFDTLRAAIDAAMNDRKEG